MTEDFSKGDVVVCLLNNRASLTIGKEYIVQNFDDGISVINDDGSEYEYHASRFATKSFLRDHIINDILK